ncbi:lysozyme inhibitor LprI family protein [Sphingomonas sp. LY29]|uniref:lysozyme inhibitor LprI family protein n=1 Tax=Sphingomonas sp. LY29 TaxID=3095341 RepID=UPI003A7F29A5
MAIQVSSGICAESKAPRSTTPGAAACDNRAQDEGRPYSLCLAELQFRASETEMNRHWIVALAQERAVKGPGAARRLRTEQRAWRDVRNAECARVAQAGRATYFAINELGCLTSWTTRRADFLQALAISKR